ncbi:Stk1 family PASTA domain-containing Ser/Thr kinase [Nigerium massiliense]|uniref:Stk1 family PASTA domain-containing Ser/Thr kinase n=1 Tax=Nigerium massiliense TaxID=1522317 RepID=UPI00058DA1DA|nr:Stk1 family PASTA domain-containing Ser/Thr kinase [Nigerium massiliense]
MTGQGTVLGGRYELGPVIGRGGMAQVRRAHDRRLNRDVAVKQLRLDLASDPTFQTRFRREAQAAAGLNHPNIVSVYDTGEQKDDDTGIAVPYIVMELVDGLTLRDLLREGRPILPQRALQFTQGVLNALEYSHRAGIVHRDIKPANVMLTNAGDIKVMDFGIARAVADTSSTMTQTAAVIGTAQYLSPEQARGETVDTRSDLYSAGTLLYELLVGRPPFTGDSPVSVAYQHVRETPVPPSQLDAEITPAMDAVVLKALAKNPDDRYQSAAEMHADIDRLLAGLPVQAELPREDATAVMGAPATAVLPAGAGAATAAGQPAPTPLPRSGQTPTYAEVPVTPRKRSRRWLWPLLAVLLLLAVGSLLAVYFIPQNRVRTVTVPIVTGQQQATAEQIVRASRLVPVVTSTKGADDQTVGEVVKQTPGGNSSAEEGSQVALVVNAGPDKVIVPAGMIGRDVDEAMAFAKQNGFSSVRKVAASDEPADATANEVLNVNPREGTSVPEGTTLTFTYARGQAEIPDVSGFSVQAAERALDDAGFTNHYTEESTSQQQAGTVVGTDPAKGSKRAKSTRVKIIVAKAPESPSPSPSTSSSDSPPPSTSTPSTASPTPTTGG